MCLLLSLFNRKGAAEATPLVLANRAQLYSQAVAGQTPQAPLGV
nr:MAG TPA: hypothetical protein [Caudoviricetes sp.]